MGIVLERSVSIALTPPYHLCESSELVARCMVGVLNSVGAATTTKAVYSATTIAILAASTARSLGRLVSNPIPFRDWGPRFYTTALRAAVGFGMLNISVHVGDKMWCSVAYLESSVRIKSLPSVTTL